VATTEEWLARYRPADIAGPPRVTIDAKPTAPGRSTDGPARRSAPTPSTRRQVEAMAGFGVPEAHIATVIGIDPKTLRKHSARNSTRRTSRPPRSPRTFTARPPAMAARR
jgi:hypothetical protein